MEKFVAYYRLSLMKKNSHGLGIDAQKSSVKSFVSSSKGNLIEEFTEIETGTHKRKRKVIYQALEVCKRENATLLIAKLDRLTRDELFLFTLLRSIEQGELKQFVCCDNPNVNALTLKILSILASDEAKRISSRTKAALQEKKLQGVKLGKPENLTYDAQMKGIEAIKQKAIQNENNKKALGYIKLLREQKKTFSKICIILNQEGFRASEGGKFYPSQVYRLYRRTST